MESLPLSRLAKQPTGLGLDSGRLGTTLPSVRGRKGLRMERVSEANSDPSFSSGFVPVSVKDISVNNARACYAAKKSRKVQENQYPL